MNLFSRFSDCLSRMIECKRTLVIFAALFVVSAVLGVVFITTPAIYEYHLTICDRFVNRVCFSDRSVFVIFLERTMGNAVLLLIISLSGIHVVGCALPPIVFAYRAYTFGGSLYIFFKVYQLSGALIVVALYLPIHLLIDAILLCATTQTYARAPKFTFCRQSWTALFSDFFLLFLLIVAICLVEMVLLLALFHPLGNIF